MRPRSAIAMIAAASAVFGLLAAPSARAQETQILSPGDAVVTGFSGYQPNGALLVPGMNPLDQFFINPDGASAQIKSIGILGQAPEGQLTAPGVRKQIPAREIGQVFPVTLLEAKEATIPPAILLGATSMYGLHIVKPDTNGDGRPERIRKGEPGATWMPGMFADEKGGTPGAIWRVNGLTGDISLFATIPGNSGPGLGDIVFDKTSRQVYVSDLDTGLIHRLDEDGQPIDSFDHGADGRTAAGLAAIADDGAKADIESPAFDIEKPETWGLTAVERRVHALAIRDGRLYYTVDQQVWSIGLGADGSFAGDPRWELDVETTKPDTQLSDMLFDKTGRMYIAERGAQRGSYDYAQFAEAESAEVKRYVLEEPDDPATDSRWVPDPETYAIGLPAEHKHSNGGISLGFTYDETGMAKVGSCGEFLWTTGERLRAGEFAQGDAEGDPAANADVHGLQGNAIDAVRPENVPPMASYFTDYDSFFGDAEKAGHIGDVEIWQPCEGAPQTFGELPPWWGDIPETPPDELPPDWIPPEIPYESNLELTKRANPQQCFSWGPDWLCRYQIRIRNTGPDDYFGDLLIRDTFPANPAGLDTFFQPQPPWFCWQPGGNPADTRCWRPNVFLGVGQSTFMTVWAKLPKVPRRCRLTNVAEIEWAPGGTQWNTDPTDDLDAATAIIPDPECEPDDPKRTDLELKKRAGQCIIAGNNVDCAFRITVENVGANDFFGPITVRDEMPAGTMFMWAPGLNWNCGAVAGPGTSFECTHKNPANVFLQPTDQVNLWVYSRVSIDEARQMNCKLHNRAWIVDPLGPPQNTNPANDKDSATAQMPPEICERPETNLKLTKTASPDTCSEGPGGDYFCRYIIRVINEGPGTYTGTLEVKDTFPNGTDLLLGPGPWTCDPAVGNTRLCKFPGIVNMPKNTARSFPVWLKVPPAVAAQHECRIRNVAKIIKAPGGSPKNTNPGDDEDDAVATIPAEICKGPETKTNLEIEKRATPAMCERTGQGIKCDWTIRVNNTGPGQFNGNIVLNETLPGEPLNASWNAPWNCVGAGGGGGAICTRNNASIAAGNGIDLNLTTYFSPQLAKQYQCQLTNLVEIAQPAGNTPKNTDPTDDTAQATASVDPAICKAPPPPPPPPPTDCPPGYIYDDGQCVPKGAQCPRGWTPTPVRGKCCPPGEYWNGRRCIYDEPPGIIDPPPPPPPVFCPRGMDRVGSLRAHYLRQKGWTVRRYRGLWCVKPPQETYCPHGYEEVPRSRVDVLRQKGWTITRVGRGKWCGKEPPVQSCPRGMQPVSASKVPYLKQEGWRLTRLRNGQWCGRPAEQCPRGMERRHGKCVPIDPVCDAQCQCKRKGGTWSHGRCITDIACPSGMQPVPATRVPYLKSKGWNLNRLPNGKWCGKPGRTEPICDAKCQCTKKGGIWKRGQCFTGYPCWNGKIVASSAVCPPEPCGRGFTGYKPNCKPVGEICDAQCRCRKSGGNWSHGKCQPAGYVCPNGKRVPSKQFCPPELHTCWNGQKVRNPKLCPPKREACPPGTVGKWKPNCQVIRKPCPPGTIGRFQPNCRAKPVKPIIKPKPVKPIIKKPAPPQVNKQVRKPCPPGTIGKWQPNCRAKPKGNSFFKKN